MRLLHKSLQFRGEGGFKSTKFMSDQLIKYDTYMELTSYKEDFPAWFPMNYKVTADLSKYVRLVVVLCNSFKLIEYLK